MPERTWITKIYRGIKKRWILGLPPKICYGSLAPGLFIIHRLRGLRYPGVAGHMQVVQRSY